MATATRPTDLLRVSDLDATQVAHLLELAARMKEDDSAWRGTLQGESLVCFFEKPSTRTRVSFAAAAYRLGLMPLVIRPDELQLGRGEPVSDTARVLSGYAAGIVLRTFAQSELDEMAAASRVPVINALSNDHHPCQALADLLTVREHFGGLAGIKIAFVGDGDNVASSLIEAGTLMGMHVTIACPSGHEPQADVLEHARLFSSASGGSFEIVADPAHAVHAADVVYTDVWVSMGSEAEAEERVRELSPFRVDGRLLRRASADAIFLHCLPAHRGEEVTAEVIDGPQSAVWQQADNRMPTEEALLHALLTGDWRL